MSSSKLAVGIVGLPNVGKSTLFNALLKKQQAYAANFPFATIEPNIGIVPVPDERLKKLADVVESEIASSQTPRNDKKVPIVPATVEFLDIAGLIAGAHKGEGLGNKFLANIRETDAICHVVRGFTDPEIVKEGSVDPASDLQIIETELLMADHETLSKQKEMKGVKSTDEQNRWSTVVKLRSGIEKGIPAREIELTDEEKKWEKQLSLLTSKPILIAFNIDEEALKDSAELEKKYAEEFGLKDESGLPADRQVIAVSARVEEQLAGLDDSEQAEYLSELGVSQSSLERLIKKAFSTLGLITFLTAGEKEVRAWTIKSGIDAQHAAGEIHTDFSKKFIKADVVSFDDFVESNGWKGARDSGKVRQEGRDYIVADGDVIEFKIGV